MGKASNKKKGVPLMANPPATPKVPEPTKPGPGRPIAYTQDIADAICAQIACTSKSLRTICDQEGMPCVATVLKWLREDTNGFLAQYTRAKEEQADYMAEEMIDIADDGTNDFMTITKGKISYNIEDKEVTSRSKLRVETRKWIASKLKPKKYGEKLDVSGGLENTLNLKNLSDADLLTLATIQAKASGK